MSDDYAMQQKFGPYLTREPISTDGQSVIYHGMHAITGQDVTLRVMVITTKQPEETIQECMEILEDTKALDLPNISHVQDYGHSDNILYVATDYWAGGSLQRRMAQRHFGVDAAEPPQLPSTGEVLQMVEQVAVALDALHEANIVHAQLSASSILFDDIGNAALGDVGLVRLLKSIFNLETTNSFNITRYSAPELWEGERPSPAADLYALACLVYELLTGKPPFENNSIAKLMNAHANDVAAPPHYIRHDLPGDLAMVFWQALAKPVDRRYATAHRFYLDLADALRLHPQEEDTDFFTFPL